jgi:hypothetical protein
MNRIQAQWSKLWQLLTAPETGKTYQQAGALTGDVLKETGTLFWLVLCVFLVGFEWFWKISIQSGRDFRDWLDNMEKTSPERIVSEASKAIANIGKTSLSSTLSQAKKALGLPEPPTPTAPAPAPAAAKPVAVAPPVPTPPPAPPAPAPAATVATEASEPSTSL